MREETVETSRLEIVINGVVRSAASRGDSSSSTNASYSPSSRGNIGAAVSHRNGLDE